MCAICVDYLNTGDCIVNDVCNMNGFHKVGSGSCLQLYCERSDQLEVPARVQRDEELDLRVTKGHGSRGYDWLRVSVISGTNSTQHSALRDSDFFS